jgi:hypothetical protein
LLQGGHPDIVRVAVGVVVFVAVPANRRLPKSRPPPIEAYHIKVMSEFASGGYSAGYTDIMKLKR